MKFKLLSISKGLPSVNIGDYIQALASAQFYPHIDGFVERDELRQYKGENCKVIMNGWYMQKPENWPPSDTIKPLFVAFHINSLAKEKMLAPESIDYLKRFAPIGCRDTNTCNLLRAKGVDAYFSGCMTLTLGKKYKAEKKNGKVYFVDPYFKTDWTSKTRLSAALYLLLHFLPILAIAGKYPEHKSLLRRCMILTAFYREYRKYFSRKVLTEATYICQQDVSYARKFKSDDELLQEAERLVKDYAAARLVVTSRIHCALPCLGVETPVIFTENVAQSEASKCRFGGLRDFFNVMVWKDGRLKPEFAMTAVRNSDSVVPENKENWKPFAEMLESKCTSFIND